MAFGNEQDIFSHYDPCDCGVIFGTGWAGFDCSTINYYAYSDPHSLTASAHSCFHSMPSIGTSIITVNWKLRGYQNSPVAACATGNIAIGDAYEIIRSGKAPRAPQPSALSGWKMRWRVTRPSTVKWWAMRIIAMLTSISPRLRPILLAE